MLERSLGEEMFEMLKWHVCDHVDLGVDFCKSCAFPVQALYSCCRGDRRSDNVSTWIDFPVILARGKAESNSTTSFEMKPSFRTYPCLRR